MNLDGPNTWALKNSSQKKRKKLGCEEKKKLEGCCSCLQVEEGRSVGPYEEDEHADHGDVADHREEMVLRHLEQAPRRRRRGEDGRRRLPVPPQDDVRGCAVHPRIILLTKTKGFQLGEPVALHDRARI